MSITPIEMNLIGINEDYFDDSNIEDMREYISRKRKADLVFVVSKVLKNELSEEERKVLLGMLTENKVAKDFSRELNTSVSQIYRMRNRAERKVEEIIKYVLLYRNEREQCVLAPLELRRILSLAKTQFSDCPSIVHRLRKLMSRECIDLKTLYETPGLSEKSVNEIFNEKRTPDIHEIIVFSNFFGISADYLLKGDTTCQNL